MCKRLCVLLLLFTYTAKAHSQTITVNEISKLIELPSDQIKNYLVNKKHLAFVGSKTEHDVITSTYMNINCDCVDLIFVRKNVNNSAHLSIEYDLKPNSYVDNIRKQLSETGFKLKSAESNKGNKTWEYYSNSYSVYIISLATELPTIITFAHK